MPKLPPKFTNCSVYIYKSVQEAHAGEGGACGFIIQMPSQVDGAWFVHYYVVTNEHVIRKAGDTPTLRINTRDGKTEIFKTSQAGWTKHQDGDDIAVLELSLHAQQDVVSIAIEDFVSKDKLPFWIGIGTETLMVGRFMSHDGKQRNTPVVRYGNIALMPEEPIELESGIKQECFLVEMRSIPGTSGSAVFAVYSFAQFFEHSPFGRPNVEPPRNWVALLGIDFCHLNTREPVRGNDGKELEFPERYWVRSNAGMAAVVPAWRLRGLLECDDLANQRLENDRKDKRRRDAANRPTFD